MGAPRSLTRATRGPDSGGSLVEIVVAMGIASLVLAALLGATISAARASVEARIDQQASDLLTKSLEDLRSLDYGAVAMATGDLTSDPSIAAASSAEACTVTYCWEVPNDVGVEPLVTAPTGGVNPHISTVTANANGVTFVLRRYVTQPPGENTRRITAVVTWNFGSAARSRSASTIFANTRRGLPLPKFVVSSSGGGALAVNIGGTMQVPFIIKNLGARDSFELRVFADGTLQTGWTFYPDVDCAGSLDPDAIPAALTVTAGTARTGDLFPDSITCFVAVKEATTLGVTAITVQGQSTKQPSAETAVFTTEAVIVSVQEGIVVAPTPSPSATASGSPTATPTETPTETPSPSPSTTQVCINPGITITPPNGYTLHRFVLQNSPLGNTETIPLNPMQRDDCGVQTTSHAYSTEINGDIGRAVAVGGSTDSDGGTTVAEWRWLPQAITSVSGTAVVTFWHRCTSTTADYQIALGQWNQKANTNEWTVKSTVTSNQTCTGDWQVATATLTVPTYTLRSKVGTGAVPIYLDLRIAAPSGSQVRLNYDAAGAPSTLFVGTNP